MRSLFIFPLFFSSFLFSSTFDTVKEFSQKKNIDYFIKKENKLINCLESYLFETANFNFTTNDLKNHCSLSDYDLKDTSDSIYSFSSKKFIDGYFLKITSSEIPSNLKKYYFYNKNRLTLSQYFDTYKSIFWKYPLGIKKLKSISSSCLTKNCVLTNRKYFFKNLDSLDKSKSYFLLATKDSLEIKKFNFDSFKFETIGVQSISSEKNIFSDINQLLSTASQDIANTEDFKINNSFTKSIFTGTKYLPLATTTFCTDKTFTYSLDYLQCIKPAIPDCINNDYEYFSGNTCYFNLKNYCINSTFVSSTKKCVYTIPQTYFTELSSTTCKNMKCSDINSKYFNNSFHLFNLTLTCSSDDTKWTITHTNGNTISYESCPSSLDYSTQNSCKDNLSSQTIKANDFHSIYVNKWQNSKLILFNGTTTVTNSTSISYPSVCPNLSDSISNDICEHIETSFHCDSNSTLSSDNKYCILNDSF